MDAEKKVVRVGTRVIAETEEAFRKIKQSTLVVNRQIREVSGFLEKISLGSERIASEISLVATISEQATAQTRAVASSSAEQMRSFDSHLLASRIARRNEYEISVLLPDADILFPPGGTPLCGDHRPLRHDFPFRDIRGFFRPPVRFLPLAPPVNPPGRFFLRPSFIYRR
ncbi:Hypothetical protein DEACI_0069 [Acididesulfobacillus acetoxydans]|uniref:Ketose-bisphosphate aldolase, class-II n=1 Tax=Acididesulfobacillus acetoxydans TaxID=1561005 RepID=A0A8S0XUI0_9FIRM|nr:Hypothetical protein DEACI_0069 [Acididesulfobacillus acetoxydans]CEJ06748.1 Ketose-bisphosphate aldolase, class-II [Acididesulfobacillus acetoxydans]